MQNKAHVRADKLRGEEVVCLEGDALSQCRGQGGAALFDYTLGVLEHELGGWGLATDGDARMAC